MSEGCCSINACNEQMQRGGLCKRQKGRPACYCMSAMGSTPALCVVATKRVLLLGWRLCVHRVSIARTWSIPGWKAGRWPWAPPLSWCMMCASALQLSADKWGGRGIGPDASLSPIWCPHVTGMDRAIGGTCYSQLQPAARRLLMCAAGATVSLMGVPMSLAWREH